MNNNVISIISNGFKYEDCWERMNIRMSMENICSEISLSTLNFFEKELGLFKSSKNGEWKLKKGNQYIAMIDNEKISTGYIDRIGINYDANNSDIEFYLRDKTSDIVDCCYFSETENEFKNQTLLNIFKKLCDPFSIEIEIDPTVQSLVNTKIENYTVDQGRSVADLIVDECVKLGILVITNPDGKLLLTQPTLIDISSDILTDTNILSAQMGSSLTDRYSNYITKAEIKPDKLYGIDQEQEWIEKEKAGSYRNKKKVEDAELRNRFRPYIMLSDTAQTIEDCIKRSLYEANIRRAKGLLINYTLEGWTEVNSGKVWKPNRLVNVRDNKFEVDELMLINAVNLNFDSNSGYTATLELVRKECYSTNEQAIQLIKKGF